MTHRRELSGCGIRNHLTAQRRVAHAELVAERGDVDLERPVEICEPAVEHGDGNRRSGRRLDVPRTFDSEQREVPLAPMVQRTVQQEHPVNAGLGLSMYDIAPSAQ